MPELRIDVANRRFRPVKTFTPVLLAVTVLQINVAKKQVNVIAPTG